MKFSLNSLNKFIDLKDFIKNPSELSEKLSSAGFEVEGFSAREFNNLVIGEISKKAPHPSADRLSLCYVQADREKPYLIVCGASNFKEKDKAVLALPDAVLPGGLKIKTRKIRGEISEGMLVSLRELGFAPQGEVEAGEEGILILPGDAKIGENFASYAGLNDTVFDIEIMPNRPDALSHFGLSRELSCILNRPFKPDFLSHFGFERQNGKAHLDKALTEPLDIFLRKKNSAFKTPNKGVSVEVRQAKLCPRYTGQAVYGVRVKTSPLWLRIYLQNLGLKSINNVVDLTNYFLMEWGQPLHAFDGDLIGNSLIVDFFPQRGKT